MTFDKYEGAFDIFDNCTMDIAVLDDYDDYENTYIITVKDSVSGDLQPYSGELAKKEYGFDIECQYAFYCHKNDDIQTGAYLTEGGKAYEIVYAARWDMGCAAFLKEVDLSGRREQDSQGDTENY